MTDRYITDRNFPDKAIDALDEAGSRVHLTNITVPKEIEEQEKLIEEARQQKADAVKSQNFELAASFRDHEKEFSARLEEMKAEWEARLKDDRQIVGEEEIANVVSMMSGVPVQRMAQAEGIKLAGMKEELQAKVIAQDPAIEKVTKAILRSRVGLKDPNRPIGTFLFLGPTGVGKTHLAKQLAKYMFGSADALIRVDMSEYMEKFTVSRLVGAPPGYVGYEEGGLLVTKIRQKPYSVILFDEIEKAHSSVYDVFLQIMDEGKIHDKLGREGDFSNAIIIFTSNIASSWIAEQFNQGITPDSKHLTEVMSQHFRPEFLGRLTEVVPFAPINETVAQSIFRLHFSRLQQQLQEQKNIHIQITDEALRFLSAKGYSPQYGARPIAGVVRTYLKKSISRLIVSEGIKEGDSVKVYYRDNGLEWKRLDI